MIRDIELKRIVRDHDVEVMGIMQRYEEAVAKATFVYEQSLAVAMRDCERQLSETCKTFQNALYPSRASISGEETEDGLFPPPELEILEDFHGS